MRSLYGGLLYSVVILCCGRWSAHSFTSPGARQGLPAHHVLFLSRHNNNNNPQQEQEIIDLLHPVESTVHRILTKYAGCTEKDDILSLPSSEREALGIARHLGKRLQAFRRSEDCPQCWLQKAHCICASCTAVNISPPAPNIQRIFVVFHHKEIALKVDTAKLILAAFPSQSSLVVNGIGPEYQESMKEMIDMISRFPEQCLVLYPDESAVTYDELLAQQQQLQSDLDNNHTAGGWNLIVLDGTWAQARKSYQRYFEENIFLRRVQLSEAAVRELNNDDDDATRKGHQLRRHVITWRQVGTFEATRLFLKDIDMAHAAGKEPANEESTPAWIKIEHYQSIANEAARKELGPPRRKATR